MKRLLPLLLGAAGLLGGAAHAAVPGITGTTTGTNVVFNLDAADGYLNQPDGQTVYSWGYGCATGFTPGFVPAAIAPVASCGNMQIPGPTLVVTEGQTVTINLTNNLPTVAGNTSLLLPGFNVATSCAATTAPVGTQGLLTCEAAKGVTVSYTFTAQSPGTRAYYSGTQGDLQVEMGLYGAIVVLPKNVPGVCGSASVGGFPSASATAGLPVTNPGGNLRAMAARGESDFRLSAAAFDHPSTCYDREYMVQTSEMDLNIHNEAMLQVQASLVANPFTGRGPCTAYNPATGCSLDVPTEPYHPAYFLVNGRSFPDDADPEFVPGFPHQPYNLNPHMHPGEVLLMRIIGQGRWQHPFHEHANHVRILARDGNMLLAPDDTCNNAASYTSCKASLAGALFFTTSTTPGVAMDGLFTYTGKGLNWDMFGHNPSSPNAATDGAIDPPCNADVNGYNTGDPLAVNYYEWCADHNKPLEKHPAGDVAANGPMTLPNPNVFVNGPWYGGSPYFGPNATSRSNYGTCASTGINGAANTSPDVTTNCSTTGTTPPSGTVANPPSSEAGYAFMWHSHNERELTTNNVFPGGILTMMLVDPREFSIDESQ